MEREMDPLAVHGGREADAGLSRIARHHLSNRLDANARGSRLQVSNLTRQTVLADRLEVADHGANRRKGLLGRTGLAVGEGLWIKPCEAVHTFFMKFPIDLVYLDSRNRIRKVRSGVAPWRMSACLSAHSVIELPSGTIEATQTRPGDWLQFDAAVALE
jgi:uncharacterized membrane protein (UPF0127 family)